MSDSNSNGGKRSWGFQPPLRVNIVGDARSAAAATAEKERGLDRLTRGIGAATAAAAGFVGIGAAITGIRSLTSAASDLEQNMGAVGAVFKTATGQANAFAAQAAKTVALSTSEYSKIAALIGGQLKASGTPLEELAGQTDRLIRLGADLAAQYGGSTAEAMNAMASMFRGEADPIERYNVRAALDDARLIGADQPAPGATCLAGARVGARDRAAGPMADPT